MRSRCNCSAKEALENRESREAIRPGQLSGSVGVADNGELRFTQAATAQAICIHLLIGASTVPGQESRKLLGCQQNMEDVGLGSCQTTSRRLTKSDTFSQGGTLRRQEDGLVEGLEHASLISPARSSDIKGCAMVHRRTDYG